MNYPDWLLWLGGTLLPLGLLWLLWQVALRPERCYGYNRALLLLAPVVAAALPLLPHPALPAWLALGDSQTAPTTAIMLPTLPTGATAPLAASAVAGWPWLLGLYALGGAVGLGRLAWQVRHLRQLARQLPRFDYPTYTLVHTGGQLPTSTFGRVVFWDETTALAPAEATAVLTHELAHVRQHHTLGLLWLQVWRALLWPNPFVHLLLPALRLTHELLADQAATTATAGAVPYASLLARLATRHLAIPSTLPLLQPFLFSSTFTRLAMLQNQNPVRRWKQWLVLPALGGLFFLGSHAALAQVEPMPSDAQQKAWQDDINRKTRLAEHEDSMRTGGKVEPGTSKQVNIAYGDKLGQATVTITRVPIPPAPPQLTTNGGEKVFTYVEQMPQLPGGGGQRGIVDAIVKNIEYPELAPDARQEGRVLVKFIVSSEGKVRDIELVKGLAPAYDAAVVAAIQQLPTFVPGKQSGKPVSVSFTVPVLFYK